PITRQRPQARFSPACTRSIRASRCSSSPPSCSRRSCTGCSTACTWRTWRTSGNPTRLGNPLEENEASLAVGAPQRLWLGVFGRVPPALRRLDRGKLDDDAAALRPFALDGVGLAAPHQEASAVLLEGGRDQGGVLLVAVGVSDLDFGNHVRGHLFVLSRSKGNATPGPFDDRPPHRPPHPRSRRRLPRAPRASRRASAQRGALRLLRPDGSRGIAG